MFSKFLFKFLDKLHNNDLFLYYNENLEFVFIKERKKILQEWYNLHLEGNIGYAKLCFE